MLADNKLALNAEWDFELLNQELIELSAPDLDFDIAVTGFETPEIDVLLGVEASGEKADPLDIVPAIDRSKPAITQTGDTWILSDHRLRCGNALAAEDYALLLGGAAAQMVFTDPPYKVKVDGHVGGLGAVKHDEFAMGSGEMSPAQFRTFLSSFLKLTADASIDGAMIFVFIDWRHLPDVVAAGAAAGLEYKNLAVWDKINGGMGSLYRSQHELVAVLKNGTAPHINNVELGRHGRYRTNVWRYAGASMFRKGRKADLEAHPTVKPVGLIADAIKDCSHRGGIILDPFGGSGTTLLAAERTGRRARLIEIDPWYCDIAVKRWQVMTGKSGRLERTGETIEQVTARMEKAASAFGDEAVMPNEGAEL